MQCYFYWLGMKYGIKFNKTRTSYVTSVEFPCEKLMKQSTAVPSTLKEATRKWWDNASQQFAQRALMGLRP